MLGVAGAFGLGLLLILNLPHLPSPLWLGAVPAVIALWLAQRRLPWCSAGWMRSGSTWLLAAVLGACWCAWTAQVLRSQWLDPGLENRSLLVTGVVDGLPSHGEGAVHFDFRVDQPAGDVLVPERLRLGWYEADAEPRPGDRWTFAVRLRRPHGFVNPGGFDYERWLFEKGIGATGSVQDEPPPRRSGRVNSLDRLRDAIASRLRALAGPGPAGSLLPALTVGDRRGLDDGDWDVLRLTGTSHLMAISGLHIGLVAALGLILGRGLCLLWPALARRPSAPRLGAALGLLLAAGYAALAGFSLPTIRALVMLTVVLSAVMAARQTRPGRTLGMALLAVLILDPLAPLSGGFWLSFAAVAALLWALTGRERPNWWRGTLLAQWAVALMLFPLVAGLFGQAVLLSPLVNLVAIPLTGVILVPLSLLCVLLLGLGDAAAAPVVQGVGMLLEWGWRGLEWIAALPGISLRTQPAPTWSVVLAVFGALLLLLPRGIAVRWLGPVFALPLFFPAYQTPPAGSLSVVTLDVGQGLAVLVRTSGHSLLYDAGPRFRSGFDAGESVVLPALRSLGVHRLDRLLVSHGDSDHAGGAQAVSAGLPVTDLWSSDPERFPAAQPCVAGERWHWDGVEFELLHPMPGQPYLGNDSSCVLRITAPGGRVLLPGDISELVERRLLRDPEGLAARVLVAPHHGSTTSSSAGFVAAVDADVVIYSAGYLNRFDMPRLAVDQRYERQGAQRLNTAHSGAVSIDIRADGRLRAETFRSKRQRIWRPPAPLAPAPGFRVEALSRETGDG